MSLESDVAALTTATTNLLTAVNTAKSTLDSAVSSASGSASSATNSANTATEKAGIATGAANTAVGLVLLAGAPSLFVNQSTMYGISNYNIGSTYSVAVSAGTVSRTADKITFTAPASAQTVTLTITKDGFATQFSISIAASGIPAPTNQTPTNSATNVARNVTLIASEFYTVGIVETHASSDWQLATDSGFANIAQSKEESATVLTHWTLDSLAMNTTYYWRVRYRGSSGTLSDWSAGTSFTTRAVLVNEIGTPGAAGFGVGVCPEDDLPSGMVALTGTDTVTSDNYGNYQYTDGSIMVWVPAFYYKWGTGANGLGLNEVGIKNYSDYASIADANNAGYALHRAFYDGGAVKTGFFIDKYGCSNNSGKASSVKNGLPLSSASTHNKFSALNGAPADNYYGAIAAAKTRGNNFFCASIFQHKAMALLSYAHGKAAGATTWCAWYDSLGVNNFPKGNNVNSTARCDYNDNSVKWETDGYNYSGKTGSAGYGGGAGNVFAKSTHNGQPCGVADLNGNMWEIAPGLTSNGTNVYILKTLTEMKSVTGGNSGATDLWGASGISALYDSLGATYESLTKANGWVYYGNVTAQVFKEATSGNDWNSVGAGIAKSGGTGGTNPFGNDGCYQPSAWPNELCPISGGTWGDGSDAGVWALALDHTRSLSHTYVGFRAALYL